VFKKLNYFLVQYIRFLSINFADFLPLQSKVISARIWNNNYHFILAALPYYRIKGERVQFCENSHSYACTTSRIFLLGLRKCNCDTFMVLANSYTYSLTLCETSTGHRLE